MIKTTEQLLVILFSLKMDCWNKVQSLPFWKIPKKRKVNTFRQAEQDYHHQRQETKYHQS